jgi:hypothetical protein
LKALDATEKLPPELEVETFFLAIGEDISTLILGADPRGDGRLVEELLASVHKELVVVTSPSGGAGVANPRYSGGAIGVDGGGKRDSVTEEL